MIKEELYASINKRYGELKHALEGTDLKRIKELALEVHAMVHLGEVSGRGEKTIADYVLEYMLFGNQNELVPRERYDNAEWQRKIGASITDTGNALEFDEVVAFGKGIRVEALRDYMIAVGKNIRHRLRC